MLRQNDLPKIALPAAAVCMWRHASKTATCRGIHFGLTLEQFAHVAGLRCLFCGVSPGPREVVRGRSATMHEVVRIVHDQGFSYDNAAPCCEPCLAAKADLDAREFVLRCKQVASWHKHLGIF